MRLRFWKSSLCFYQVMYWLLGSLASNKIAGGIKINGIADNAAVEDYAGSFDTSGC